MYLQHIKCDDDYYRKQRRGIIIIEYILITQILVKNLEKKEGIEITIKKTQILVLFV